MNEILKSMVECSHGAIKDNLADVEKSVIEFVDSLKGMVVTEETIKDGKQVVADIRKRKEALDQDRKEIKKAWMRPYEDFEKRVKSVIALYDKPIEAINSQLREFEENRIKAKRDAIQEAYTATTAGFGDLTEWLPLERLYNKRWENATYPISDIKEDIEKEFHALKIGISSIKALNSKYEADALQVFKETRSLESAMTKIGTMQEQEKRILEEKAKTDRETALNTNNDKVIEETTKTVAKATTDGHRHIAVLVPDNVFMDFCFYCDTHGIERIEE